MLRLIELNLIELILHFLEVTFENTYNQRSETELVLLILFVDCF